MKIQLVYILIISLATPSFASVGYNKVLPGVETACAAIYANKLKNTLPVSSSDKFKHCALSCHLSLLCGSSGTVMIGIFKELADLVGPGNAEWNDLRANFRGIFLSKKIINPKLCYYRCARYYRSGPISFE